MKIISRIAQQPIFSTSLSLSQIMLYSAESIPLLLARRAMGVIRKPDPGPPENHRQILRAEIFNMLKEDFKNINGGLYTIDFFSSISPLSHFKRYLRLMQDSINSAKRAKKKQYKHFSAQAKEHGIGLPDYYLRNFHYQTDGYLSEGSADLYEHQTEILFMGTLNLMRRLLLVDLIAIGKKKSGDFRVLEIGAGTGVTTEVLLRSWPHAIIEAIDLSEPYLAKARQHLNEFSNVQFIQADGVDYRSLGQFDAVVSTYCLHEVPLNIRKQIVKNAAANLKKGGHLLLIDSLQLGDRQEFDWALKQFPKDFHEPFFTNYVRTPLNTLLSDDLELVDEKSWFLSKAVLARKL